MDKHTVHFLNQKVHRLVGGRAKEGELYGIELEMEGFGVQMAGVPVKGWKVHEDGSLRGENAEWVFNTPADYPESMKRLYNLFEELKLQKVKFNLSDRTSTHVHLNFSDRPVKDVVKFFTLYTVFEEVLEAWCGDKREGNFFCLSNRDAEYTVRALERCFNNHSFESFHEEMRYAAINLHALRKFGTIELRSMRGVDNPDDVVNWLTILREMYLYIDQMGNPKEVCEKLSLLGAPGYLSEVFSEDVAKSLCEVWGQRNLRESLYAGVRLIQPLAYKLDAAFSAEYVEPVAVPFEKMVMNGAIPDMPEAPPGIGECWLYHPVLRTWLHAPSDPQDGDEVPGLAYIMYEDDDGRYYDTRNEIHLDW